LRPTEETLLDSEIPELFPTFHHTLASTNLMYVMMCSLVTKNHSITCRAFILRARR
jgi:hypothetical protein